MLYKVYLLWAHRAQQSFALLFCSGISDGFFSCPAPVNYSYAALMFFIKKLTFRSPLLFFQFPSIAFFGFALLRCYAFSLCESAGVCICVNMCPNVCMSVCLCVCVCVCVCVCRGFMSGSVDAAVLSADMS